MKFHNLHLRWLKKIVHTSLVSAALLIPATVSAQSTHESKEVLLKSSANNGGFIGLSIQQTNLFDQSVTLTGGQGAWQVSPRLMLGLQAQSLTSRVQTNLENADSLNLTTYGLYGEVNLYTWRFLSARASTSLGAGSAGYRVSAENQENNDYAITGLTYREGSLHLLLHVLEYADIGLGYGRASLHGIALKGFNSGTTRRSPLSISLRKVF